MFMAEVFYIEKLAFYKRAEYATIKKILNSNRFEPSNERDLFFKYAWIFSDKLFVEWMPNFKMAMISLFFLDMFMSNVLIEISDSLDIGQIGDFIASLLGGSIPIIIAAYGCKLMTNIIRENAS
jgi:hypothetical protein